jgi:RING-box protein 1
MAEKEVKEDTKGPKKKFEVKKWNAVALWAWGKNSASCVMNCRHRGRQLRYLQKSHYGVVY